MATGNEAKKMTLYRYYCKMRPPGPGAVPKRNLYAAIAEHVPLAGYARPMWGFADYTAPLTDEEMDYYELVPGGTVEMEESGNAENGEYGN